MSDLSKSRRAVIIVVAIIAFAVSIYGVSSLLSDSGNVQPTLLFFRIDTCPYCQAMAPVVDDIKQQYRGELDVEVLYFDTDYGKDTADEYGVIGTPTVVLLDAEGLLVGRYQGVVPQDSLVQAVEELLGH